MILKVFILLIFITIFFFYWNITNERTFFLSSFFCPRNTFLATSLFLLFLGVFMIMWAILLGGMMEVSSHFTPFMYKQIKKIYLVLNNLQLHLIFLDKIVLLPLKFEICRTMLSYIAKSNVNNIVAWNLMNLRRKYSIWNVYG